MRRFARGPGLAAAAWAWALAPAPPAAAQEQTFAAAQLGDQRRWNNVADLLRAVEPAYASAAARREASDAVARAELGPMLEWSGEAGVLLLVPLQVPDTGPGPARPLGGPIALAVGAHPLEAAMVGLYPTVWLPESGSGMHYDDARSFFVWAGREQNRLRFRRLTAADSGLLRRAANRAMADKIDREISLRARSQRIIDDVAVRYLRQPGAAALAGPVEEARVRYAHSREALDQTERNRRRWRQAARGADEAADLVRRYRNILTMRELRAQANALTRHSLRDEIRRSDTGPELLAVLEAERGSREARLAALDVPALCRTERQAYAGFFAALRSEGAQGAFLRRLLPEQNEDSCLEPDT